MKEEGEMKNILYKSDFSFWHLVQRSVSLCCYFFSLWLDGDQWKIEHLLSDPSIIDPEKPRM